MAVAQSFPAEAPNLAIPPSAQYAFARAIENHRGPRRFRNGSPGFHPTPRIKSAPAYLQRLFRLARQFGKRQVASGILEAALQFPSLLSDPAALRSGLFLGERSEPKLCLPAQCRKSEQ